MFGQESCSSPDEAIQSPQSRWPEAGLRNDERSAGNKQGRRQRHISRTAANASQPTNQPASQQQPGPRSPDEISSQHLLELELVRDGGHRSARRGNCERLRKAGNGRKGKGRRGLANCWGRESGNEKGTTRNGHGGWCWQYPNIIFSSLLLPLPPPFISIGHPPPPPSAVKSKRLRYFPKPRAVVAGGRDKRLIVFSETRAADNRREGQEAIGGWEGGLGKQGT
jgi:hypothetical protein